MITPQQSGNLQVKPKWQLPVGVMEGIVAYNCCKYGMPRPVLAMPMWEGAGNRVFDYSGNSNHGTINGADWVAGGLDFVVANNDYVNVGEGNGTFDFTDAITIHAKINMRDGGTYPIIISKGWNQTWAGAFLGANEINRSYICIDGGVCHYSTGSIVQPLNEWSTVSYVYGNGYQRTYMNGTLDLNRVQSGNIRVNNEDVNIGQDPGVTPYSFDGIMSFVYVYNQVLSAAQIKFLHDNPYFMFQIPEELYGYVAPLPSVSGLGAYFARREQWCGITV